MVESGTEPEPQSEQTHHYSQDEKNLIIAEHMAALKVGTIQPEFAYKDFKDNAEPEFEKFKTYHARYLAGEVTPEDLEIYEGDWLVALKAKDRKKNADFITSDGFQNRHNEIAVLNNRPCTDLGNAERLVDQFGTFIRYCHPMKMWYVWNRGEGRWKGNEDGYINRMSQDVVRRIGYEAAHCPLPEVQKRMYAWAYSCECKTHIYQMSELASNNSHVIIQPDDFDKDDMLFNLRNGTFNLKTGQLMEHNKDYTLSKISDFEYKADATCPMFLTYLDRIFRNNPNKQDVISFLQRAVGYTLTGRTDEQCLFLLYGAGANGKSVFLDILSALMGEYGTVTQSKTFTTNRGEISNDIAALQGKRYVCASENSTDSNLDESIIKQLTGGEQISARFLHKEFFVFRPKFKIWWSFNHPPAINDMTVSIWRRIKIIPFAEILPEHEWDKKLSSKIIEKELPGVFNWALSGLAEYNHSGLQTPDAIIKATKEYKNDQDILKDFFESNYQETESELDTVNASVLYSAYKSWWYSVETDKPMSSTKFGRLLRDRGLTKIHTREGWVYQKIRSIHAPFRR